VYELSEKITNIELNDKSKINYRRKEKVKSGIILKSGLSIEQSMKSNLKENLIYSERKKIVSEKLLPILEDEFKLDVRHTGEVLVPNNV
jgi:hypothetical protein